MTGVTPYRGFVKAQRGAVIDVKKIFDIEINGLTRPRGRRS